MEPHIWLAPAVGILGALLTFGINAVLSMVRSSLAHVEKRLDTIEQSQRESAVWREKTSASMARTEARLEQLVTCHDGGA